MYPCFITGIFKKKYINIEKFNLYSSPKKKYYNINRFYFFIIILGLQIFKI